MVRVVLLLPVMLALFAFPGVGKAYEIPISLFPTGVGPNRISLPQGTLDPHYKRSQSPTGVSGDGAYVVLSPPATWVPNTRGYAWIGVSGVNSVAPSGVYDFSTIFDLSNLDPASTTLRVTCASDNQTLVVLLNAVPLESAKCGAYTALQQFTISPGAPFKQGSNTLTFRVYNSSDLSNPTGVLVSSLGGSAGCEDDVVCKPDYFCNERQHQCDRDQDGDMVFDLEECSTLESQGKQSCSDSDGDGIVDLEDTDDDNDGIETYLEFADSQVIQNNDVDKDGLNNWVDLDANGDRLPDGKQGRQDERWDGIPSYLHTGLTGKVGGGGTMCSLQARRDIGVSSKVGGSVFIFLVLWRRRRSLR